MAHLQSRQHISPDSGTPLTLHPLFNPKIASHVPPPQPLREEVKPGPDRTTFADPEKKALFAVAKRLDGRQLDELAALVTESGVVFFRDQDLDTEGQVRVFEHYGVLDRHPAQKDQKHVIIKGGREDHREILKYTPWPSGDFHADTSFEINPPSYSLLRMEEHPEVGGDTAWVSQYGLYDALSDAYKKFLDGLHAVHTSRLQYDTILDLWGVALNVNPGFVTGFAELKKDKILDFLAYHIHAADDHYVRWKWAVGSVAMWDNRCTAHRVIPGTHAGNRKGIRTTVFGEKPYFDPASESRNERSLREKTVVNGTNGVQGTAETPA
ncbi:hypothetical protein BJX70DRAFT_398547 [Aspergillus crustosus]